MQMERAKNIITFFGRTVNMQEHEQCIAVLCLLTTKCYNWLITQCNCAMSEKYPSRLLIVNSNVMPESG